MYTISRGIYPTPSDVECVRIEFSSSTRLGRFQDYVRNTSHLRAIRRGSLWVNIDQFRHASSS